MPFSFPLELQTSCYSHIRPSSRRPIISKAPREIQEVLPQQYQFQHACSDPNLTRAHLLSCSIDHHQETDGRTSFSAQTSHHIQDLLYQTDLWGTCFLRLQH